VPVRKAIAIFALVSLLAGPISVWPAAGCCGDTDCCKSGICPMHASHAKSTDAAESEHCHHAEEAPAPAPECAAKAQCTGQSRQLHPAPQPRGVLSAATVMPLLAGTGSVGAKIPMAPTAGFVPIPFEPPRRLA